jgi:hypothetical protein
MIGRIVWFTALAALAVLTTALQLDLMARRNPAVAAIVPEPLRAYAQVRIVERAVAGTDGQAALAEARTLVRRRPMPAESLALLAAAEIRAGEEAAGLRTIQIAAARGWREPRSQEAMLRLALANADAPEAARRYVALFLRTATPDALLTELGPAVLDGPDAAAARDTIVAVVVGGERWHAAFLRRGVQVMPPAAFAAIAEDSIARGVRFDCGMLKTSLAPLTRRDAAAAARLRAAALGHCPQLGG